LEGCYYDKVTILPELVGLNAYEVYLKLFEKDPQKCTKCNQGKLYPISAKAPVPSRSALLNAL
jgi:hypothetical protein